MILPIVAYGAAVLRKMSPAIEADYPGLALLIEDMWETMYESNGVGLAAPQINKNIRLFVMDSEQIFTNREQEDEVYPDAPHAFHADYRATYREGPAKDGWEKCIAWFKKMGVA